jgi:hypothetical protein
MTYRYNEVFCDALCVTYAPDSSPLEESARFLESLGFNISFSSDEVVMFHADVHTSVRLETKHNYHKIEVKGLALELLRTSGSFSSFLSLLGSHNHKVTRLDLALDVPRDFPSVLHGIRVKYPTGYAKVSRKKAKISEILEPRDSDGKRSGTLYIGSQGGKARKFARIYDKQLESLRRDVHIPPTTRYEFVIREDVTLRDAYEPSACFWHFMGLDLLKTPKGVPKWVKGSVYGWSVTKFEKLPVERLLSYLDNCPSLDRMVTIADEIGPNGRSYLLSQLRKKFDVSITSEST